MTQPTPKKRKVKVFINARQEALLKVISTFLQKKVQKKEADGTMTNVYLDTVVDSDKLLLYALEETAGFIIDLHRKTLQEKAKKLNDIQPTTQPDEIPTLIQGGEGVLQQPQEGAGPN